MRNDKTSLEEKINEAKKMEKQIPLLLPNEYLKQIIKKMSELPELIGEKGDDEDSFIESFKKHKVLWISLFTMIFTTFLGILGIIILACKIHSIKHPRQVKPMTGKIQELSSKFITSSEVQT